MNELNLDELLFKACDSFIKNINRYNWSLVYESDFCSAIYAELIKTMDREEMRNYIIRTEHKYGNFTADIAIGDHQEVAIETKFSFTYWALTTSDFVRAKKQLEGYIANGAKYAYLICLDHQIPPDRKPISDIIDIEAIGLVGDWREINAPEIAGDRFLVAQLKN